MKSLPPMREDEQVIKAAEGTISRFYKYGKHHVGVACEQISKIFTAVNLEANVGRVIVCAEAIVLGEWRRLVGFA